MFFSKPCLGIYIILLLFGIGAIFYFIKYTKSPKKIKGHSKKYEFDFVADNGIRGIIQRDYNELQKVLEINAWKSSLILIGSLIESILSDQLIQNIRRYKEYKGSSKKSIDKLDLANIIDDAVALDIITPTAQQLSHTIREYRNLVHPGYELRNNLECNNEEVEMNLKIFDKIYQHLRKHRQLLTKKLPNYIKAVEKNKKNFDALKKLGLIYHALIKYDLAIKIYKRITKLYPRDTTHLFLLADTYEASGQLENALDTYNSISDAEPYNKVAENSKLRIEKKLEQMEKKIFRE